MGQQQPTKYSVSPVRIVELHPSEKGSQSPTTCYYAQLGKPDAQVRAPGRNDSLCTNAHTPGVNGGQSPTTLLCAPNGRFHLASSHHVSPKVKQKIAVTIGSAVGMEYAPPNF
ncbi:hypothetical protein N7452_000167 [Penicillium brevicompactum]|uniref:Uncharacterized protein n=1 Tax=Penicillium brevicompactum TaxID=5074 RepID=A0A9W9R5J3_PENBR|nr:hypothetical protein N7452_000167 [Penicillium brevicompactum]